MLHQLIGEPHFDQFGADAVDFILDLGQELVGLGGALVDVELEESALEVLSEHLGLELFGHVLRPFFGCLHGDQYVRQRKVQRGTHFEPQRRKT